MASISGNTGPNHALIRVLGSTPNLDTREPRERPPDRCDFHPRSPLELPDGLGEDGPFPLHANGYVA
jgi:hypothetical protein